MAKTGVPKIDLCVDPHYFQRVIQKVQDYAAEWRCGQNRLDIWFGDTDDGTGKHPNFQIELHVEAPVKKGLHKIFRGVNGEVFTPDPGPGKFDTKMLSGPYNLTDVREMLERVQAAQNPPAAA